MQAKFTKDFTVRKFNIQTKTGRKSTKDMKIQAGTIFTVSHEFSSGGMATHGNKCLALKDGDRFLLIQAREVEIQ